MGCVYILYTYIRLVCDELPNWGQNVGAIRLAQLNEMDQVKVQHVGAPVQSDQAGFRNAPITTYDQRNTRSPQPAIYPCDLVYNKAIVVNMDYQQTGSSKSRSGDTEAR